MQRIVWPIDAQEPIDRTEQNVARTLKILTRAKGAAIEIEPVYVLPADYVLPDEYGFAPPLDLKMHALKILEQKLGRLSVAGLLAPQILEEPVYTNTQTARTLIEYAKKTQTDLIAVGTHARHGLLRALTGSFSEALILHSPVPVLTINPETLPPHKLSHIVFATTFEHDSLQIFSEVLDFAQKVGAKITIYHQILNPLLLVAGPELPAAQRDVLAGLRKQAHHQAGNFIRAAKAAGVEVTAHIFVSDSPISETLIRFAQRHGVQLIAMPSRSGRVAAAITGSVTRQVVRTSPFPVWVLREQAFSERALA